MSRQDTDMWTQRDMIRAEYMGGIGVDTSREDVLALVDMVRADLGDEYDVGQMVQAMRYHAGDHRIQMDSPLWIVAIEMECRGMGLTDSEVARHVADTIHMARMSAWRYTGTQSIACRGEIRTGTVTVDGDTVHLDMGSMRYILGMSDWLWLMTRITPSRTIPRVDDLRAVSTVMPIE